VCDNLCVFLT